MKRFSPEETEALLPYPALAEAIADILRAQVAGRAKSPERIHLELPGGMLLVMPAADDELAIAKLVTVHPGNAELGLPTIQGEVVVMDARTGKRLGILDGKVLTARRTAALSLLAARLLAPEPRGPLLIVGAGVQARSHIEAFHAGLDVQEVFIASRTRERAEALAERVRKLGMKASLVGDFSPETPAAQPHGLPFVLAKALAACPLVVTATTSRTPVLPDSPDWLRPDRFIVAVGAYTPAMAEIPPAVMRGCRVFCDTLEGGLREAGDIIQAGLPASSLTPLEAVLDLPAQPPGPTVFKSVGHALFDLAAAQLAFGK